MAFAEGLPTKPIVASFKAEKFPKEEKEITVIVHVCGEINE